MTDDIVLMCTPDASEGEFKTLTSYGTLADGKTVEDALAMHPIIGYEDFAVPMEDGSINVYRIHVCASDKKVGPFFCEHASFFTPFIVTMADGKGLHCMECAMNFVQYMILHQSHWAEQNHGDWWQAHSQRQHTGTHRLS